jgi:hypothetical protein
MFSPYSQHLWLGSSQAREELEEITGSGEDGLASMMV